ERRLRMLFEVSRSVLPHKPNRVVAATYHGFIADGKLVNSRGDLVS
ncbi:MAG: hypothetical protein HKM90_02350, partial [Desulfobacteraceae bacterium]|nr:hypothetical protein [Desulfobacteraceae bacterium]